RSLGGAAGRRRPRTRPPAACTRTAGAAIDRERGSIWLACWSSGVTCPGLPLGVADRDATLVQALAHGARGDIHARGDPGQRPPLVVEPDRVVDLLLGQAAAAHRNTVAVEDRADGAALDAELITQLVDRGAGLVALDQLPHLVAAERGRALPAWVSVGRVRSGPAASAVVLLAL